MVPAGAKPIAVQRGADHFPIGEAHRRRSVPGLHHGGMVLVEAPAVEVHLRIADPRFGDQHHHRVRQRAAAHHQKLERVVEACRVALVLVHDRKELGDILAEQLRLEAALACPHPVHVALQRVDLAVVTDVAVGVRQRPGRKRIRAETGMDDDQRAGHAGVGQILVVLRHLVGEQQSLVDDRVAGQARDVEILPPFDGGLADSLFDALADDVELALELRLVQDVAGDEDLADGRFRAARLRADRVALDRHVPPAKEPGALLRDHLLHEHLALLA